MRKSQSTLEFLMTYGWAIVVVIIAIGSLAYFGVLDVYKWVPESCTGDQSFSCVGKPYRNGTTVSFSMINNMPYAVDIDTTRAARPEGCTAVYICPADNIGCEVTSANIPSGQQFVMVMKYFSASRVSASLSIPFNDPQSGLASEMKVNVRSRSPSLGSSGTNGTGTGGDGKHLACISDTCQLVDGEAADECTLGSPCGGGGAVAVDFSKLTYDRGGGFFALTLSNTGDVEAYAEPWIAYKDVNGKKVIVPDSLTSSPITAGETYDFKISKTDAFNELDNVEVSVYFRYGKDSYSMDSEFGPSKAGVNYVGDLS